MHNKITVYFRTEKVQVITHGFTQSPIKLYQKQILFDGYEKEKYVLKRFEA